MIADKKTFNKALIGINNLKFSLIKKAKVIFLTLFFVVNIISPYSSFISFEKKYNYIEDRWEIKIWNIQTVYEKEVSLYKLPNKISKYYRNWELSFDKPKDLIVFKFDKTKIDVSDIKIIVNNWNNKFVSNIDDDWDERILLDKFAYSEPILVNQKNKLNFIIESTNKVALETVMQVSWVDVTSYSENIVWKPDSTNAEDNWIIKRSDWWADETLRYKDNPKWIAIYKQLEESKDVPKTDWQLKQEKRIVDIRAYLATKFPLEDTPINTVKSENWHELVWPIENTKLVNKIFIHHTAESMDSDSRDDASVMRSMYYYHTITRWWWDIWYNYVVWRDGKIYEWRSGWDYVVAAHNLWNNKSTAWISVMWNFQTNKISDIQKNWVDRAIWIVAKKYWIDLNKKSIAHKECSTTQTCLLNDFEVWNLSGHRDAWSTACPWDNLYWFLQEFRDNGKLYSIWLSSIFNTNIWVLQSNLPKWPNIKIRLSFTWSMAEIRSYTKEKMKIEVGSRSWFTKLTYLKFEPRWTDSIALIIWNKSLKIPSFKLTSTVLEVSNWSRKPAWDTSWTVNDNKFRWSITVTNDNGKLVLINELPLEDYLKWIAEISNNENEQKAKTILVAARSYALWYINPNNRKFPWKPYDGSDSPDEFQKYLGYGFEMRWTNISKYIDDTNLVVIKYGWKLIKPWYFNQSNGKTKSYKEYCEQRKVEWSYPKNMVCDDIPYLQSVSDPAWNTTEWFKWHWVWISWAGAKYMADTQGKKYDEIIKYFLKWVTVEKTNY